MVDEQACIQYLQADRTIDVVVFGHTHDAKEVIYECKGKTKIYANSGTWIDANSDTTANFVVIGHCESFNFVDVCIYEENGSVTKIKPKTASQLYASGEALGSFLS